MTKAISADSFPGLTLMLVSRTSPTMLGADRGRLLRRTKTKQQLALRPICVESMGDQDANAKDQKKCCDRFKKHGSAQALRNKGLMRWPSKKPASAAQSKIFESGALILLLLMIPGNGCRRLKGRYCDSPALKPSLSSNQ